MIGAIAREADPLCRRTTIRSPPADDDGTDPGNTLLDRCEAVTNEGETVRRWSDTAERLMYRDRLESVWMNNTPTGADEPIEPPADHPGSALDGDRYAHLPLADGSVVIYDREHPDTWVQSDYVVDMGG